MSSNKIMGNDYKSHAVVFLVILYFILHIPHFILPISGGHRWRQTTTASVSRNYVQESFNFFKPRIDVRGDTSGIAGMEFPIYNYLVSLLYKLSGTTWVGFGKLLSFIFGVISLFLITRIINYQYNNISNNRLSILIIISGFLSPYFFRFCCRFMPETFALFCSLLGFYYFYLYIKETNCIRPLIICWFGLTLGAIIRPYMIFFSLPVLCMFIFLKNSTIWKRFILGVLGLSILIPFYLWYYLYVPYLNNKYGIIYFNLGGWPLSDFLILYLDPSLWIGIIKTIFKYYIGYTLLPFFLYGIYHCFKGSQFNTKGSSRRELLLEPVSQIFFIGVIAPLYLPVIIGKYFILHFYYFASIFPLLTICIYYGFHNLHVRYPNFFKIIIVAVSITLFASMLHSYRLDRDLKLLKRFTLNINQNSNEKDLFVVDDGGSSTFLYFINRKGWSDDFTKVDSRESLYERLDTYRDKGAKFALIKKMDSNSKICGFELIKLE